MAYRENRGKLPRACVTLSDEGGISSYRAVHVRLFGGWCSKQAGHDAWPAGGGREKTNWGISAVPHAFEIEFWEVT